jgi:hypothetical protein
MQDALNLQSTDVFSSRVFQLVMIDGGKNLGIRRGSSMASGYEDATELLETYGQSHVADGLMKATG